MMDDAERCIAVLDVVDEDAHRANVVERFDAGLLPAHLVPDAVDVLGPAPHLGADAGRSKLALQPPDHVFDVPLPVDPSLIEELRDRLVRLRLERAQRKILELPLELPDAET